MRSGNAYKTFYIRVNVSTHLKMIKPPVDSSPVDFLKNILYTSSSCYHAGSERFRPRLHTLTPDTTVVKPFSRYDFKTVKPFTRASLGLDESSRYNKARDIIKHAM